jgi:very-short-patch-repair endonuclease
MNEFELKILRFTNNEIMNEIDGVVDTIKKKIEELKSVRNAPSPL